MNWFSSLPAGLQATTILAAVALLLLGAGGVLTDRGNVSRGIAIAGAVLASIPAWSGGSDALAVVATCALAVIALLILSAEELEFGEHTLDSAAVVLLGAAGGLVLATSSHLLSLVLGLETLSLSLALLCGLGRGPRPVEAAFKFFVLAAVGLATIVYGIGLFALATGSFELGAATSPQHVLAYRAASVMLVLGLLFELAVVPMHFGSLGAYMAAPTAFAGFAMTAGKLAAGIALLRLTAALDPAVTGPILVVAGCASIVWATFAGLAQKDLRGMLAYSAVGHAGFVAIAIGSGDGGRAAAVFYLVVYAASSALVFAALAGRGGEPIPYDSLRTRPLPPARALALGLGLLSLAGLPPGPGLWAKIGVLVPAWHGCGPGVAVLAALGGVFGALYYLRPLPDLLASIRARAGAESTASVRLAVTVAGIAVLAFTVFPWLVTEFAAAATR